MDAAATTSLMMAQPSPLAAAPRPTADAAKADAASKEYESVFISQFLGSMFSGIKSDGIDLTDILYHRHRETIALPPPDPDVVGQG